MVNAQEWLDKYYPKEGTCIIEGRNFGQKRSEIIFLDIEEQNLAGVLYLTGFRNLKGLDCSNNQLASLDVSECENLETLVCSNNQLTSLEVSKNVSLGILDCSNNQLASLDVSENVSLGILGCSNNQLTSLDVSECENLKSLYFSNNQLTSLEVSKNVSLGILDCSNNQLTNLEVSECENLKELDCSNNQLTSLDVSDFPKLTNLYCNAEFKITGLEKTSIVRLDCQHDNLVIKSQDPHFIWEVFVRKFNFAFPEMKLIEIADLNELAGQVNSETIQNEEFLGQFCNKRGIIRAKEFWENEELKNFYWILDTLANQILARCLVIQNRLYTKQIEVDYETHLIELAQGLDCLAMNPVHPEASLRPVREKLVNQAIGGDIKLLTVLQDLPYLKPEFNFSKNPLLSNLLAKIKDLETEIEQERQIHENTMDTIWEYRRNFPLSQNKEAETIRTELSKEIANLTQQLQLKDRKIAELEQKIQNQQRERKYTGFTSFQKR